MTIGFVILANSPLRRTAQLARTLSRQGGAVAVHIDRAARPEDVAQLTLGCREYPGIELVQGIKCKWGHWSLVQATLLASKRLLSHRPDVSHIFLLSGDSVPLVALSKIEERLEREPEADHIESVSLDLSQWVRGGLERERLSLFHPWSWVTSRRVFDFSVRLQRALGVRRSRPHGLQIHVGSQWWCLTRRTLEGILEDSRDPAISRYFRHSWIPDESFFQTLSRKHASRLVSENLMHCEFDSGGQARIFYDDNLPELTRSAKLFARKIWSGADQIYDHFLWQRQSQKVRIIAPLSVPRRAANSSRILPPAVPMARSNRIESVRPYTVLIGVGEVFERLRSRLNSERHLDFKGRLFGSYGNETGTLNLPAGLSGSSALRAAAPCAFLSNLLRASGSKRLVFTFHPADELDVFEAMCADPNAHIISVRGGWVLSRRWRAQLFCDQVGFAQLQRRGARIENMLERSPTMAQVTSVSISHATSAPASVFRPLGCSSTTLGSRITGLPVPVSVGRLQTAESDLCEMRDAGVNPGYLDDIRAAVAVRRVTERSIAPVRSSTASRSGRFDRLRIG